MTRETRAIGEIVTKPELSIIVATYRRPHQLRETLSLLGPEAGAQRAEVIVVDDASGDQTPEVLAAIRSGYPAELRSTSLERNGGPGAARNRGIEMARAPLCLFLGDDIRLRPGSLARHRAFHRDHPEQGDALLGRIVPGPRADSPFTRWLHEQGKQFAFARISPGPGVAAGYFYAANCSLKVALLKAAGGFDESFRFGHEEQELSHRLAAAGLRLTYDSVAVAEHDHPTDLRATLLRMREFGRSFRLLTETVDAEVPPRRPGHRHRAKAAALAAIAGASRSRSSLARTATWEFLCDQAHREGFWGEPDPAPEEAPVRIGARLAQIAERDLGQERGRQPAPR